MCVATVPIKQVEQPFWSVVAAMLSAFMQRGWTQKKNQPEHMTHRAMMIHRKPPLYVWYICCICIYIYVKVAHTCNCTLVCVLCCQTGSSIYMLFAHAEHKPPRAHSIMAALMLNTVVVVVVISIIFAPRIAAEPRRSIYIASCRG